MTTFFTSPKVQIKRSQCYITSPMQEKKPHSWLKSNKDESRPPLSQVDPIKSQNIIIILYLLGRRVIEGVCIDKKHGVCGICIVCLQDRDLEQMPSPNVLFLDRKSGYIRWFLESITVEPTYPNIVSL